MTEEAAAATAEEEEGWGARITGSRRYGGEYYK
jgi:hypothetical protein